jgi:hypothetical protein
MMNYTSGAGFTGDPIEATATVAVLVFILVTVWKVYTKAGRPGWAAIIPIYGSYILLKVAKRPGWWLILYLIPLVNIITHLVVSIDVAKAFGKGTAFGVSLLWLFPFIGYPILAFGKATYRA